MRLCIFLALTVLSLPSFSADQPSFAIKQLALEKSRVVIVFTGTLEKGSELIATFEKGKQCSLRVTAIKGQLANLDTSKCASASELSIGHKLESSLLVEDQEVVETTKAPESTQKTKDPDEEQRRKRETARVADQRFRFVAGLGYQIQNSEADFDEVYYNDGLGNDISGTGTLKYKKTHSLILEGRMLPSHSWGFMGGLNYEGERRLESGSLQGEGIVVTLTGGSNASKIQFATLYGNAAYRWTQFYIPFGFNYSVVKFTPANGATGSTSATGTLGAQLGVGFFIADHFAIELYSWVTSMKLKSTNGLEVLDWGLGIFPSTLLAGKYVF